MAPGWYPNSTTLYVYDGRRVVQERNSANGPTVSYVRGLDLSGSSEGAGGIGGLLARSSGYQSATGSWTSHAFYHADGGGNVTFLSPSTYSGTMTRYSYDAYGRTTSLNGPLATANVYRFSSKELHAASGHYYYGYRFYDPQAQRWINRDPLGEAGGMNLYGFVGNGPVGAVDRNGMTGWALVPPQIYWDPEVRRLYNLPDFQKGVENGAKWVPHSIGACVGGDASVGWAVSAHAEASLGVGLFSGNLVGGYFSHGESVGPFGLCSPQNTGRWTLDQVNPVFGAYAGCGPGGWVSNAQTASDLGKTTHTFSFNIGLGAAQGGLQLSFGGGIYQLVVSPPSGAPGLGIGCSLQKTTTYEIRPFD